MYSRKGLVERTEEGMKTRLLYIYYLVESCISKRQGLIAFRLSEGTLHLYLVSVELC